MHIFFQLADGLILEKTSCPLGVLLIIFESRPDALVQVLNLPFPGPIWFGLKYFSFRWKWNIFQLTHVEKHFHPQTKQPLRHFWMFYQLAYRKIYHFSNGLDQIASLAIRSGNGLLLKGGKEAKRSNAILYKVRS